MEIDETAQRTAYLLALSRTVPTHLVNDVLAAPSEEAVGPQHYIGSIMVADLVGFTSLCERLAGAGAEGLSQLSRLLDGIFEALLERAIEPFGGQVVQFGGDSMTVIFRDRDHAGRAAAAALTAIEVLSEVGATADMKVRIGLAAGQLSLPVIGDLVQRFVLCSGPVAHRAVELQRRAAPNTIVADGDLLELLEDNAGVDKAGQGFAVLESLRRWPKATEEASVSRRASGDVERMIELLEPFVPPLLAARLRTTPKRWRVEGELRDAVIVFAELGGLDGLWGGGKDVTANAARSLLRAFRRYGGVVCKVDLADQGHRLMALFGLYSPTESDPERAILAALEATGRLRALGGPESKLSIRLGIHAGKVYSGAIGSARRHDVTVVGDAVNIAARVASTARPFEVVVTEPTLRSVAHAFQTSARPPTTVKGKRQVLDLHVVHGPASLRAHYVTKRKQTRFYAGREREIEQLNATVDAALAGEGRIVGITGPTGTGKSFLLSHLIDRWVGKGGTGVLSRCRYATANTPLGPVMETFANYFGFAETDTEAMRRERIRAGFSAIGWQEKAPELVALLEPVRRADGSSEAVVELVDSGARARVIAAIAEFVHARADDKPLLYIFEDLHLSDSLTLELALHLTSMGRDRRLLLVGTYRPDPAVARLRRAVDLELELQHLEAKDIARLIGHELGGHTVDPEVVSFLWQRTLGNPGHLVEAVRFLGERGLLPVRAGVVGSPGQEVLDEVVPRSLAHLVLAKLDGLGAVEKRLLRLASTVGRSFDRGVVESVGSQLVDKETLEGAFDNLEGAGVIVPREHEGRDYMFRDNVTRLVTYRTIPEHERRVLHQKIADSLEGLPGTHGGSYLATVGHHRERAGQHAAAATAFRRAAKSAARAGMQREARALAERWETCVAHLPAAEQPSAKVLASMTLLRLVAAARLGLAAEALQLAELTRRRDWSLLSPAEHQGVDFWSGHVLAILGRRDEARALLVRTCDSQGTAALRSDAARLLAFQAYDDLDWSSFDAWLGRARELCEGDGYRQARLDVLRADAAMLRGHFAEAAEVIETIEAYAHGNQRPLLEGHVQRARGRALLLQAELQAAQAPLRAAAETYHSLGHQRYEARAKVALGEALLWAGDLSGAAEPLEHALAMALALDDQLLVAEAQTQVGLVRALSDDLEQGEALCLAGYERAVTARSGWVQVLGAVHLCTIAQRRGDEGAIRAALERRRPYEKHMVVPLLRREIEGER